MPVGKKARGKVPTKKRKRSASGKRRSPSKTAADVFVSYSHKDKFWKDWLLEERFAAGLGTVEVWCDDEIRPSQDWMEAILDPLERARIAVLLVSQNFLASDFIRNVELPRILKRRQEAEMTVLWILIEGSKEQLKKTKLAQIQGAWPVDTPLASLLRKPTEFLTAARRRIYDQIRRELNPGWVDVEKALNDKYELVTFMGRGDTKAAYLARDHTMKRWVAVTALRDLGDLEEFRNGLLHASRVDDIPSFMTVYEAWLDANPPHCVRQYVEGQTLAQMLRNKPLQYDYARDVLLQLARGIYDAHEREFYHCNIKPSNIVLDGRDRAYLSPLSRRYAYYTWIQDNWNRLADETRAYAIPEFFGRAVPRSEYSKSDQYQLGMVGHHMLTGNQPQRVKSGRRPTALESFGELRPIRRFQSCQTCPQELETIIMRMTRRDPADRFDSLGEVVERLEAMADSQLSQAKDSFHRIAESKGWEHDLLDSFYEEFLGKCTNKAAADRFKKLDWQRQFEMLREAILLLLTYSEYQGPIMRTPTVLTRVRDAHAPLGITASDCDLFGELLVNALVKADPAARTAVDRGVIRSAWERSLAPGLRYMKGLE